MSINKFGSNILHKDYNSSVVIGDELSNLGVEVFFNITGTVGDRSMVQIINCDEDNLYKFPLSRATVVEAKIFPPTCSVVVNMNTTDRIAGLKGLSLNIGDKISISCPANKDETVDLDLVLKVPIINE